LGTGKGLMGWSTEGKKETESHICQKPKGSRVQVGHGANNGGVGEGKGDPFVSKGKLIPGMGILGMMLKGTMKAEVLHRGGRRVFVNTGMD